MSDIPLKISNIHKSFSKKKVLDDVSLNCNKGEIFGLIGLNGEGKTTLIKIILDLLKQDSGEIEIFGEKKEKSSSRRHLCYLPEKFAPSAFLKGKEYLSITLEYYGKKLDLERANYMAERLGLEMGVFEHKLGSYSKGMGQKTGLLGAILSDAPLLILDEPMSGLDPRARIQLKELLIEEKNNGKTIFFSSHILSDIDEICQNIAILHNTKIIYQGNPHKFREKSGIESLERAFLQEIAA